MRKIHTPARSNKPTHTDDLLHMVAVMVRKAEREPETADKSLAHAQRAFDVIIERMS